MSNMFRFLFDKDTWQELRESLTKNKLRTIITMIGVWWGILLLIGLLGSAKGIENKLADQQLSNFYKKNINLEKDNAFKFAKKRNLLNDNKDYEKKLSKMARAGFSYEIAKEVLK